MIKRIILLAMMVCCISMTAQAASEKSELKIVLDQEALMQLGTGTRNDVLNVLQSQAKQAEEAAQKAIEKTQVTAEETMDFIAGVNVEEFKGKAVAFAEAVNVFCEKIGVTVNEFITTPAGNFIVFGALWKLGFFGSIWGFFKGVSCIIVLLWLLYSLNTKKVTKLNEYNHEGKVTRSEEILVPRLTGVFSEDPDERTCYAVFGSLIILVFLFLTFCFVL